MKKKVLMVLLAATLSVSMIAGCGGSKKLQQQLILQMKQQLISRKTLLKMENIQLQ